MAEMTIFVPKLHRSESSLKFYSFAHLPSLPPSLPSLPPSPPPAIHAREQAATKKLVSNVLALNLVTQLYRLGAIEPVKPPGAKKSETLVCREEIRSGKRTGE